MLRGLVADAIRFEEIVSRSRIRLTQVDVKMDDLETKVGIICLTLVIILFKFIDLALPWSTYEIGYVLQWLWWICR